MRRRLVLAGLGALSAGCVSPEYIRTFGSCEEPSEITPAEPSRDALAEGEFEISEISSEIRFEAPPNLTFTAGIRDPVVGPENPGTIELRVRNEGRGSRTLHSGPAAPFGVIEVGAVNGKGSFYLWQEDYASCVNFTEDVVEICSIGEMTDLGPCESVSRTYEILPSTTAINPAYTAPPGPGQYQISESLSYTRGNGSPESEFIYQVEFMLESLP